MSGETFEWWKHMVHSNRDAIIVSVHHYVLKDTTVASGEWEGMRRTADGAWMGHYHGYFPQGSPNGASYLYYVGSQPDSGAFEGYLAAHPGAVDIWLGGHTHTHPDDAYGDKSHVESRWSTHFINAACLSRWHGSTNVPKSRVLTFREGSDQVQVRCCLHTSEFLPEGWYAGAERVLSLSRPFHW